MPRTGDLGRTRAGRSLPLPRWLVTALRPASSGPVRYWQERTRLALKGSIAAAAAWALAKYAAGQPNPVFAPLAALLGVYPTVGRSLREGSQYVGGFVLGAVIAVPVGVLLGPGVAGVVVVVVLGMLVSSWSRLGEQSGQVTFTALFALLLGGHQPLHYITQRASEVAIGIVTGLVVNVVVFPPIQLRPAQHAIRLWGEDIAYAMGVLALAAVNPRAASRTWSQHDRQLTTAAQQAHAASRHAGKTRPWQPRAGRQPVPPPDGAVLDSLEELTARTRAVARSLLEAGAQPGPGQKSPYGQRDVT